MPSHRASASAIGNALALADLAAADIEVIISDNSGDPRKQQLLATVAANWPVTLITRQDCPAAPNSRAALACATGQYVLSIADDDRLVAHGIGLLAQACHATAPVAYTAPVLLSHQGQFGSYTPDFLQSQDIATRLDAWLASQRFNHFLFSAIRRDVLEMHNRKFSLHPYSFSFHDVLLGLDVITTGEVSSIPAPYYIYNLHNWTSPAAGQQTERAYYLATGLDGSANLIHWLIMTFEGTALLLGKHHPRSETLANTWVRHMMHLCRVVPRGASDGACLATAGQLKEKWLQRESLDLKELLGDLTDFFRQAGPPALADRYFGFWTASPF